MDVFVKICGLCRAEDVEAVAALAPDAMGFIFWPRSPRYVKPEAAAELCAAVPEGIKKVGVFVDAPPAEVTGVRDAAGLDIVQLHGREAPEHYVGVGASLWKVVHLDRPGTSDPAPVDAFLIDSYSTEAPGGTGTTADWDRARGFVEQSELPVLLAGGLTPENVRDAIRGVAPWGVDVSSGVEAAPGRKDLNKVRTFIERCRNA